MAEGDRHEGCSRVSDRFSRSHWGQIVKRVKQAGFSFDQAWKCFICGKKFQSRDCPHIEAENLEVLQLAKASA